MQRNVTRKQESMTVDIELVEVDRRESRSRRAFLTGVVDLVDIKMFSHRLERSRNLQTSNRSEGAQRDRMFHIE